MPKTDYSKAISAILRFKQTFDKIDPKIPRKLVGEIGEFYALQKFKKMGLQPEHKGGQGGYDIYLKKIHTLFGFSEPDIFNHSLFIEQRSLHELPSVQTATEIKQLISHISEFKYEDII